MAETGTLHDAFLDELRDAYDAEKQLTKALPKMAKAASSPELRAAFEAHLEETRGQVDAAGGGLRDARREGARQALRRHRGHHRGRQVRHGGGLRRHDDGCVPDRRRPARRALRDGGLRHAGGLGARDGSHGSRRLSCRRRSTKRRPPTRSCRRWPRAGSTRRRRTWRTHERSERERRGARRRSIEAGREEARATPVTPGPGRSGQPSLMNAGEGCPPSR